MCVCVCVCVCVCACACVCVCVTVRPQTPPYPLMVMSLLQTGEKWNGKPTYRQQQHETLNNSLREKNETKKQTQAEEEEEEEEEERHLKSRDHSLLTSLYRDQSVRQSVATCSVVRYIMPQQHCTE